MIISSTSKLNNLKIGLNWLPNINMMLMFLILIYWCQPMILSNTNIYLVNY